MTFARALPSLLLLTMSTGCVELIPPRVATLRTNAGSPMVRSVPSLAAAAKASAARMCAAGVASPAAHALTTYGEPTTTAVHELAASAVLDPGLERPIDRNGVATNVVWAAWANDPVLVEARWNEIGVGEVECADGKLYMSLVLRDVPPGLHPEGKTWLFMGQELGAVGGFPASLGFGYVHDQGYVDYVGMPEGVTIYTDVRFTFLLRHRVNFGTGDLCGQCYLDNPAFAGRMIAIGLYMVGDLENVVSGARDASITTLGEFIRDVGRPVFLRIGYEFDGSWNGYDKALYVQAFRRIMDRLRAEGVTNVVSVWQSSGFTTSRSTLLQWYPGDDYVDWVGYSYFKQSNPSGGMMTIARERRKPVMIAEATPQRNLSLGDEQTHWDTWFAPFFAHVHANADIVKNVAYINTRWFDQPEWGAGWGDSRVQIRPLVKASWIAEMQDPMWAPGDFANAANTYVLTPHDLTPP
ncbi:MAG: hypothetical protein KIT14_15925 [bacterium]|nr:hypothetical protein [bacterium]